MNLGNVFFAFFIVLSLTLNFGFFIGDIANPAHHNVYELFAAIVVNLIATVLKFGERTQIGAVLLASSLVADLQLIVTAIVWGIASQVSGAGSDPAVISSIVSLAGGAMVANVISVVLLTIDTANVRR